TTVVSDWLRTSSRFWIDTAGRGVLRGLLGCEQSAKSPPGWSGGGRGPESLASVRLRCSGHGGACDQGRELGGLARVSDGDLRGGALGIEHLLAEAILEI